MKLYSKFLALTVSVALLVPASRGAVIIFQDGVNGYDGTQDTNLASASSSVTFNYGANTTLSIGRSSTNTAARREIISFDLSSLQGTFSSIDSVSFTIYSSSGAASTPQAFSIYQVVSTNAGWIQGTGLGTAIDGTASWSQKAYAASGGTNWTGGAGLGAPGAGYSTTAVATGTFSQAAGSSYTFTLSGTMIASWINSPSTNGGLIIRADNEAVQPSVNSSFNSSEAGTVALRPSLTVTYTAVPEPGTVALLSVTGLAMVAWRARRTAKVA